MPGPRPREWVSFEDPDEDRTWTFDVTFLLSRWACLYGSGCQGVLTEPAPELATGCCSYGAHFTGPDDEARVQAAVATLSPAEWQFFARGSRRGIVKESPSGERVTRMAEGACILLNRPGFATGPGCALHQAAVARGVRPMDLKPDVCWQLPLRREDRDEGSGHVTSTVSEWGRREWGAGGAEFAWWCTEAPEAFDGALPVFEAMADELRAMVGPRIYGTLAAYLASRTSGSAPLPHPVLKGRRATEHRPET